MPSHDLLVRSPLFLRVSVSALTALQTYFQSDLTLLRSWYIDGRHYSRTLEAWLKKQDQNAKEGLAELEKDAESKGLNREDGRKAFYRYI